MFGKEKIKLQNEKERLAQRVKNLESATCNGLHSYVETGEYRMSGIGSSGFDFKHEYESKCEKCGKTKWV